MIRRLLNKWVVLAGSSAGTLWLFGCVTSAQARDFLSSSLIRTFYQTLNAAIQAALVDASA